MRQLILNTKIILDYLKTNKLSKKDFCEKCGISLSHFNKVLKNNYADEITITKISQAMKVYPFVITIQSSIVYVY